MHYIGLMSGTSVDAADAALVTFDPAGRPRIQATATRAPPRALRAGLLALAQTDGAITLERFGRLDQQVGDWFAEAALAVVAAAGIGPEQVAAIGSHGQTVRHAPDIDPPFSMQLGSGSRIAACTGCTVVADFRSADIAAGGQGAPLAPAFHRAVFARPRRGRIVVNIGGIANLTALPAGSDGDDSRVRGFDTGPGNALMDGWIEACSGADMDHGGRWAASGSVHAGLLAQMLQEPYLYRAPPKSTGREHFNLSWLRRQIDTAAASPAAADVQATLCEFTARTLAAAIDDCGPGYDEIIVCGGGAHNAQLMQRLAALLAPRPVATTSAHGLAVDWVEAAAFAWLAKRRLEGLPGNLAAVTGARRPAILGAIHAPPRAPRSHGE